VPHKNLKNLDHPNRGLPLLHLLCHESNRDGNRNMNRKIRKINCYCYYQAMIVTHLKFLYCDITCFPSPIQESLVWVVHQAPGIHLQVASLHWYHHYDVLGLISQSIVHLIVLFVAFCHLIYTVDRSSQMQLPPVMVRQNNLNKRESYASNPVKIYYSPAHCWTLFGWKSSHRDTFSSFSVHCPC